MKKVHAVKKMIIDARKAAGLTQRSMAERMGISQPAYAYYETGTRPVTAEKLEMIASYLELPVEPFLEIAATETPVKITPTRRGRKPSNKQLTDGTRTPGRRGRPAGSKSIPAGLKKLLEAINTNLARIASALEHNQDIAR